CSLEHRQPGALPHLVVAELLTRREAENDRPRPVDGLEHGRRASSLRRLDLRHVPGLHGTILTAKGTAWRALQSACHRGIRPRILHVPANFGVASLVRETESICQSGRACEEIS